MSKNDTRESQIINYKTNVWKTENVSLGHLNSSGYRPSNFFAPTAECIASAVEEKNYVLDVGCGHGRLSLYLADRGHDVVAFDVSEAMLRILESVKGESKIKTRMGDAHSITGDNEEFDAVVSVDLMPHFPDWKKILREKARVCKSNGIIAFGMNFSEHRTMFSNAFPGSQFEHEYTHDLNNIHKEFWGESSYPEMVKAGEECGLVLVKVTPVTFFRDNHALGRILGSEGYQSLKKELVQKLNASEQVSAFYQWLEKEVFQKFPYHWAYQSVVVYKKK